MTRNDRFYRKALLTACLSALLGLVPAGCDDRAAPDEPVVWHSPVLDSLVRVYHTARNDIRAGDVGRALPHIDSCYLVRLDDQGRNLRISGQDFLRRAVWDWPILTPKQLEDVTTDQGYLRMAFITDTVLLSPGMKGQTTTFVLFHYDRGWRVAGVTRVVKPLADPYGYGYRQFVLETDLPSYMRFPRSF